jgi:hypothetical protein
VWPVVGSLLETEAEILLSERLEYPGHKTTEILIDQAAERGHILNGLMRSLEESCR